MVGDRSRPTVTVSDMRQGRKDPARAPAADQVLALLAQLARHPEPMAASALATGLGLPRSTTYRLLGILERHGLVTHLAEERRYGLGVGVYELGSAYQRQAPLQRIARPALHRLVDQTTQNAHLAVLHGRDVLYLIEERAVGRPLLVTDVGVRLPAVLTASGLAMLARLPARQVRALYPRPGQPGAAQRAWSDQPDRAAPALDRRPGPRLRRGGRLGDGRALVDRPCGHRSHWASHRRRGHHLRRFDGRRAQATLAGRASSRGGRSTQPSAGRPIGGVIVEQSRTRGSVLSSSISPPPGGRRPDITSDPFLGSINQ